MKTALTAFFSLGLSLGSASLFAQSAETPPVGFNTVECLPNSDTYCGVPFARPAVFQGVVNAVQSGTGTLTLTPEGSPGWTVDAFQTLYMVRIISGSKAGMYYQVASNTISSVIVDLAGDSGTGVNPGDSFRIHPFWTLSTLFPPETQATFVPSASTLATARRSELLLPNTSGMGFNLAPINKFYISGSVGSRRWTQATTGNPIANNEILFPDAYFIVRHSHPTITASTQYVPVGSVELNSVTIPLATRAAGQQDNFVSSNRPIPVKLKDLDLVTSLAFVPSASTLATQRRDLLMVYDNASTGINKAPVTTYYYVGTVEAGTWRKAVVGNPIADDDEILPSHGMIIRKYQTAGGTTSFWTHSY